MQSQLWRMLFSNKPPFQFVQYEVLSMATARARQLYFKMQTRNSTQNWNARVAMSCKTGKPGLNVLHWKTAGFERLALPKSLHILPCSIIRWSSTSLNTYIYRKIMGRFYKKRLTLSYLWTKSLNLTDAVFYVMLSTNLNLRWWLVGDSCRERTTASSNVALVFMERMGFRFCILPMWLLCLQN